MMQPIKRVKNSSDGEDSLFDQAKSCILVIMSEDALHYSFKKWEKLYQEIASPLITKHFCNLTLEVKLAVAICAVCTQNVKYYESVFSWLQEWEFIGGAYWLVQQELLRHSALGMITSNIQGVQANGGDRLLLTHKIGDLLQKKSKNSKLTKQLKFLREEVNALLIKMFLAVDMTESFVKYSCKYPLPQFANWTLKWGKALLVRYLAKKEKERTAAFVAPNRKSLTERFEGNVLLDFENQKNEVSNVERASSVDDHSCAETDRQEREPPIRDPAPSDPFQMVFSSDASKLEMTEMDGRPNAVFETKLCQFPISSRCEIESDFLQRESSFDESDSSTQEHDVISSTLAADLFEFFNPIHGGIN